MHLPRWVAPRALLAAALCTQAAHAAQPSRAPDPADPAAAVPAIIYQSALAGYTPAAQDVPAPDKIWRAANARVAGQPDHAMHHAPALEARKAPAPTGPVPAPAPGHSKQNQQHQHH